MSSRLKQIMDSVENHPVCIRRGKETIRRVILTPEDYDYLIGQAKLAARLQEEAEELRRVLVCYEVR